MAATNPNRIDLDSEKVTFVEFSAFWRPTCKQLESVLHRLDATWGSEIDFIYLDIDDPDTETLKWELGYLAQPHLFLLDSEGNVLEQWLGFVKAEVLEETFREAKN